MFGKGLVDSQADVLCSPRAGPSLASLTAGCLKVEVPVGAAPPDWLAIGRGLGVLGGWIKAEVKKRALQLG